MRASGHCWGRHVPGGCASGAAIGDCAGRGCGWFWRRGGDLGFFAALTAPGSLYRAALVGCVALAAVPFVGPLLVLLCIGVNTLALTTALRILDGWRAA